MRLLKGSFTALLVGSLFFSSCKSSEQASTTTTQEKKGMSKTAKGGIIGAGSGAVLGGIIGKATGNTARGAIIGAAVGGATGAVIGRRMDKQAEELEREMKNAQVERVGEGIKVTFDAGLLFPTNSSTLQASSKTDIAKLAETLKKYPGTNVLVEGHADNTGTDAINQPLSERRAQAVADYAASLGVERSRFQTRGYGSTQPVADNTTAAGRQQNRRVEVAIFASEELKKAAERGEIKY
ncbi:membrane protein [Rufibacter radiotolerans]|uniref:Membrane protein n=1 Tax=Rufibacter radiotolerans TaxID=1379910 RepID=A0A0H4VM34_9BACT|nr:OmpA family protein [Rufibacter radiotolerans]AKQ46388.1 membrane protein [Rufibacter radiotolerans]